MARSSSDIAMTSLFEASVRHTPTEPYISDVDVIDEKITIVNPSGGDMNMEGYQISDFHGKHVYHFPEGFVLPATSKVVLFCCPGKRAHLEEYQVNHLLWYNKDGTMRRKEVLNNDGDSAVLLNRSGIKVSLCTHLGEMQLIGTAPKSQSSLIDFSHEKTGVIPFWKLFFLPVLILFLMSYFFETPPETFHTKLEDIVERLHNNQNELATARHNASIAESRYEKLFGDYVRMQSELDDVLQLEERRSSFVSEAEVNQLFIEFHENHSHAVEVLRAEIEELQNLAIKCEEHSSLEKLHLDRFEKLYKDVDSLEENTLKMSQEFENFGFKLNEIQHAQSKSENFVVEAVDNIKKELSEDVLGYIKSLPPPSLDHLKEQATSMIQEVTETILKRKLPSDQLTGGESPPREVSVNRDFLEQVLVTVITEELDAYKKESQLSIDAAVQSVKNQSHCVDGSSSSVPLRDFAVRGAGGQVLQKLTSDTYGGPHNQGSKDGTLRSQVTEAVSSVFDKIGGDIGHVRRGFFETGIGGPDEAISEDLTIGSCWAMKGQKGFFTVKLKEPVKIAAVTIDHVSREEAIDISTAPQDFIVYGFDDDVDDFRPIHRGTYDIDQELSSQVFPLNKKTIKSYQIIKLEITSNHGNPNYTCLYRFRVHDEM